MNKKTKRRMVVVAGVVLIVVILLLAMVGGSSSATVTTVNDVAKGSFEGKKVQVTGNVASNSYSVNDKGVLEFDIVDPEGDPAVTVHVSYDKGVSATFGNDVTAICTGRMDNGVLVCSELVTKCPSKYESATNALTVARLRDYGDAMLGKTTKVAGVIAANTLGDVTQKDRFVLQDAEGEASLPVRFEGALSDDVVEGVNVVVMGALSSDGSAFLTTDVALEG